MQVKHIHFSISFFFTTDIPLLRDLPVRMLKPPVNVGNQANLHTYEYQLPKFSPVHSSDSHHEPLMKIK